MVPPTWSTIAVFVIEVDLRVSPFVPVFNVPVVTFKIPVRFCKPLAIDAPAVLFKVRLTKVPVPVIDYAVDPPRLTTPVPETVPLFTNAPPI